MARFAAHAVRRESNDTRSKLNRKCVGPKNPMNSQLQIWLKEPVSAVVVV